MKNKLDNLLGNPKSALGAHHLHGRLKGKGGCRFGPNIRMKLFS